MLSRSQQLKHRTKYTLSTFEPGTSKDESLLVFQAKAIKHLPAYIGNKYNLVDINHYHTWQ